MAQSGPKSKNTEDLLKFGTFDISNIPMSILMSQIIFIMYLLSVRIDPKIKKIPQNLLKFGMINISNTPI